MTTSIFGGSMTNFEVIDVNLSACWQTFSRLNIHSCFEVSTVISLIKLPHSSTVVVKGSDIILYFKGNAKAIP
jgi:hypothetical protein